MKIWQDLQIRIGADKDFSFNFLFLLSMDQDSTVVFIQCLEAALSSHHAVTKDGQGISSSTNFLGAHKNRAFAVKDRRFGALHASCLVALHHFDDILAFLDQNPD